jgi:hypothetical protein
MAVRSLLGDINWLTYATWPASASATGSTIAGFEPELVLSPLLHTSWQVPSGGPHTITVSDSDVSGGVDMVCLCAHPEYPFTGTVTVQLYTGGAALLWSSSTSYQRPVGFADRRYFVLPSRVTGGAYIKVTLATGNRLAYVQVWRAMNLTDLSGSPAALEAGGDVNPTQVGYGAAVWDTAKRLSPGRHFDGEVKLTAIPHTTLTAIFDIVDRFGKGEPLLWLPHAEDDTAAASSLQYMHATGVLGLLSNNPSFPFIGTGTTIDHTGATVPDYRLRSGTLMLEGWP